MATLSDADRAWVVAGLTHAGMPSEEIAERMSCSLRQVYTIKAQPMTSVCLLMQQESRMFADELRMVSLELRAATVRLVTTAEENTRLRGQLQRAIAGTPMCSAGHPLDRYNSYHRPDGRTDCRQCHRERAVRYRARRRSQVQPAPP